MRRALALTLLLAGTLGAAIPQEFAPVPDRWHVAGKIRLVNGRGEARFKPAFSDIPVCMATNHADVYSMLHITSISPDRVTFELVPATNKPIVKDDEVSFYCRQGWGVDVALIAPQKWRAPEPVASLEELR